MISKFDAFMLLQDLGGPEFLMFHRGHPHHIRVRRIGGPDDAGNAVYLYEVLLVPVKSDGTKLYLDHTQTVMGPVYEREEQAQTILYSLLKGQGTGCERRTRFLNFFNI